MKITRLTLSALLGVTAIIGVRAADAAKPAPRTEVTFANPEKFSDAADGQRGSEFGRDANLAELREHLIDRANAYVAEGQKLAITVTDVDLAGEVEPWRSPQMSDVRIIKDIYAPKIDLSFKLTDASGAVIKEGTRHLTDLTFTMNIYSDRSDRRVYEKGLIDNWLRSEFGRAKKK
jgi:hypothetical protein